MDAKSLKILEKAFEEDVQTCTGGLGIHQTKSKLAQKLADQGYLVSRTVELGGRFPVIITGWALTDLGYCKYRQLRG